MAARLQDGLWPYGTVPAPQTVVAPSILMLVLMPLCLGLRLWSVSLSRERFGLSVFCVTWAFILAVCYLAIGVHEAGITRPPDTSDAIFCLSDTFISAMKLNMAGSVLNIVSAASAKFSLVFLYRNIFATRLVLWSTGVLGLYIVLGTIVIIVALVLQCNPVSAYWTLGEADIATGIHCSLNQVQVFAFTTIGNVVADIVLLVLPIREVAKLQLSSRTKTQICAVFALGSITTTVAVIRLALILRPSTFIDGVPWGSAELGLSVICACIPGMRPATNKLVSCFSSNRPHPLMLTDHPRTTRRTAPDSSLSHISLLTRPSRPSLFTRVLTRLKAAVGWQPMPTINHWPVQTIHKQNRNSEEMEEFRRLYEYSGSNPFSQDAYARMTDTELWGGIRVEQTVAMRVEPNLEMDLEAGEGGVQMPAGLHHGIGAR